MHSEMLGNRQSRVYQVDAKNQVIQALEEGHSRICVILPTGSGKTHVAGLIMCAPDLRKVLKIPTDRPLRVLMIAHRHRLLKQAADSYNQVPGITVIKPEDYLSTPFCSTYQGHCTDSVIFTTLSLFGKIPADLCWDLAILDEAHHESVLTLQYKLEQLSASPIIGLTATPERSDGVLCKFSKFVETLTREDAVAGGFIAESKVYSFIDCPAREHVDMVADIVDLKLTELGQTMAFVRTKHEARELCARLITKGLTAVALVDIDEKTLNMELVRFEQKQVQFVVSCNKIGEGTDVKGCESILLGRTTQSLPLLNQLIGRSVRIDSESRIYEIINPLSNKNITASDIVNPVHHEVWYKVRKQWRHHVIVN